VRYLGIDVEDALALAEHAEIDPNGAPFPVKSRIRAWTFRSFHTAPANGSFGQNRTSQTRWSITVRSLA
jgi:hypothetical protein